MAKELQVIDNYIIFTDTVSGLVGEYALTKSVYRETNESFIIKETIDTGQLVILKSEVIAGDWVDGVGTPYDINTILTFLRQNTGFNTASGGSGAVGISDAEGKVTYYDTLNDAITAATDGDTVEMYANIIETGSVEVLLKNGVNINMNGYTYTLDTATEENAFTDNNVSVKCTIFNGTIKRSGATYVNYFQINKLALHIDAFTSEIELQGVTVYNDFGLATRCDGTIIGGHHIGLDTGMVIAGVSINFGTVKNAYCKGTLTWGCYVGAGYAENLNGYCVNGAGIELFQGEIRDSYGYSENGHGIQMNGGDVYNSYGHSDGLDGIHSAAGVGLLVDCTGVSSARDGIQAGGRRIINCTGISRARYAIHNGGNFTDPIISNCNAFSSASFAYYGIAPVNRRWTGCYGETLAAPVAVNQVGRYFNCTFICNWDNALGHCIDDANTATQYFDVVKCYLEVKNAGAYCLGVKGVNPKTINYAQNTYRGATTPVNNTYITQGMTNTEDGQGNILIG